MLSPSAKGKRTGGVQLQKILAIAAAACLLGGPAADACTGQNIKTKQRQTVQHIYKTNVSHPNRHFAEARHDPRTGRPVVVYYRRYARAPGYFKSFVRAHECCHHLGHRNEIAANCCALRRMGVSRGSLAAIRSYIVSRDVNSETKVDRRGQGSMFWSKTERSCPNVARR